MTGFNFNLGSVDANPPDINEGIARRAKAAQVTDATLVTFGKHRGQPWRTVPEGYCRWLWENGKQHEDSPVADYLAQRLRIKRKQFASPHPVQYFAVLAIEAEWPSQGEWSPELANAYPDIPY